MPIIFIHLSWKPDMGTVLTMSSVLYSLSQRYVSSSTVIVFKLRWNFSGEVYYVSRLSPIPNNHQWSGRLWKISLKNHQQLMIRLLHRSWVGPSATIDSVVFFITKLSRYDVVRSIRLVAVFEYSIPRLPCADSVLSSFVFFSKRTLPNWFYVRDSDLFAKA